MQQWCSITVMIVSDWPLGWLFVQFLTTDLGTLHVLLIADQNSAPLCVVCFVLEADFSITVSVSHSSTYKFYEGPD